MFKTLFSKEVTKANLILAAAGAAVAVLNFMDDYKTYKAQQEQKELEK